MRNIEQKIEAWFETPWPWIIHFVIMVTCFIFALCFDSTTSALGWAIVVIGSSRDLAKRI